MDGIGPEDWLLLQGAIGFVILFVKGAAIFERLRARGEERRS